jgi:hypothetical protein
MPGVVFIWSFMEPVVKWAFEFFSESVDILRWELTLQSWNDVVESQSVSGKIHPSGVSREDSKSVSWPETIVFMPASNIWLSLAHVFSQISNITLPLNRAALILEVLFKD